MKNSSYLFLIFVGIIFLFPLTIHAQVVPDITVDTSPTSVSDVIETVEDTISSDAETPQDPAPVELDNPVETITPIVDVEVPPVAPEPSLSSIINRTVTAAHNRSSSLSANVSEALNTTIDVAPVAVTPVSTPSVATSSATTSTPTVSTISTISATPKAQPKDKDVEAKAAETVAVIPSDSNAISRLMTTFFPSNTYPSFGFSRTITIVLSILALFLIVTGTFMVLGYFEIFIAEIKRSAKKVIHV